MFKNKLVQVFVVSLIIFLFSYYFLSLFFSGLNGEFLYYFKNFKKDSINKNLIVVEIDDKTYNKLGFPLDRGDYVPFLNNLSKTSPAAIGFDILFMDEGKDKIKDISLSKAFKNAGNVIVGFDIKNDKDAIMPYDMFYNSVNNVGYFQPFINPNTKKVSSIEPFRQLNYNGKLDFFDSFSFSIIRQYYNFLYAKNDKKINFDISNGYYNFFSKKIPIIESQLLRYRDLNELHINYINPNNFQRESFYNIYSGNFDKDKFKDKIVLVGYTAEGVKDDFFVPYLGIIKGVYVHANVINNILNDNYIVYFNKKLELLISFLFILLIIYFNIFYLKQLNLRWASLGAVFLFIFIGFVYVLIFIFGYKISGIYILPNYPFEFLSILFISFFASSVLKYVNEDKNKKLLSKALSEYVSVDIANEILHGTGNVNLNGERKKITMFFSDIAGFTTISEKLSPEELVKFLKVYLGKMSDIIMDNKGFINKYEGDAIMALWGVFGEVEKFGVVEACKSSLLQQRALMLLNQDFHNEIGTNISVRMGIHTGDAIIGNIGSEGRKMEFTALGDSVNLASRLEGVNKFYGTNICVSEDVYNEVNNLFEFRYLDKIKVKGKNLPVNIYELLAFTGELSDLKKDIVDKFNNAIELYSNRQFQEALEIFKSLEELGDKPSSTYAYRCEMYIKNPPEDNWDLVWSMSEK